MDTSAREQCLRTNTRNKIKSSETAKKYAATPYKPLRYPAYHVRREKKADETTEGGRMQSVHVKEPTENKLGKTEDRKRLYGNESAQRNVIKEKESLKFQNRTEGGGMKAEHSNEQEVGFHSNIEQSSRHIVDKNLIYQKNHVKPSAPFPYEKAWVHSYVSSPHKEVHFTEEDKFCLHLTLLNLYKDRIKPTLLEIDIRLQEEKCAASLRQTFYFFYRTSQSSYIISKVPNEPTCILLKDPPRWFKGWVKDDELSNPYPPPVWRLLNYHLQKDSFCISERSNNAKQNSTAQTQSKGYSRNRWIDIKLSKYQLAKAFKKLEPKKLGAYAIGELCHLVALAVLNGLLVYDGNKLVWSGSCSWLAHSVHNPGYMESPLLHIGISAIPTIADFRKKLKQLLTERFPHFIPLSLMKQIFMDKYNKIVNPLLFNCRGLGDLLFNKCRKECELVRCGEQLVVYDKSLSSKAPGKASPYNNSAMERSEMSDESLPEDAPPLEEDGSVLKYLSLYNMYHNSITFVFWQFTAIHRQKYRMMGHSRWNFREKLLESNRLMEDELNQQESLGWSEMEHDVRELKGNEKVKMSSGYSSSYRSPSLPLSPNTAPYEDEVKNASTYKGRSDFRDEFNNSLQVNEGWMYQLQVANDMTSPDVSCLMLQLARKPLSTESRQRMEYYSKLSFHMEGWEPPKDNAIGTGPLFKWLPYDTEDEYSQEVMNEKINEFTKEETQARRYAKPLCNNGGSDMRRSVSSSSTASSRDEFYIDGQPSWSGSSNSRCALPSMGANHLPYQPASTMSSTMNENSMSLDYLSGAFLDALYSHSLSSKKPTYSSFWKGEEVVTRTSGTQV